MDPVHDPDWATSQMAQSRKTFSRMDTIPNEHLHLYSYLGVL